MRQIRVTTILLLFAYCLFSISAIVMFHHVSLADTLSKMGTGCYGASCGSIEVESRGKQIDQKVIQALDRLGIRYAVTKEEVLEDNGTLHLLYFNKDYANLPMESGRFFQPADFKSGKALAVVGKRKKGQIYQKNNIQYIEVNGREYEVLGVIGYEEKTVIDEDVYVSLLSEPDHKSGMYLLDYRYDSDGEKLTKQCIKILEQEKIHAEQATMSEKFSTSVISNVLTGRWFIGLLFCCLIGLLLVSIQWVNAQKTEVAIRRLLGASRKRIAGLIAGKYVGIVITGYGIGYLFCAWAHPEYLRFLRYGYEVSLILIVVFLIWSVWSLFRESIPEGIK